MNDLLAWLLIAYGVASVVVSMIGFVLWVKGKDQPL